MVLLQFQTILAWHSVEQESRSQIPSQLVFHFFVCLFVLNVFVSFFFFFFFFFERTKVDGFEFFFEKKKKQNSHTKKKWEREENNSCFFLLLVVLTFGSTKQSVPTRHSNRDKKKYILYFFCKFVTCKLSLFCYQGMAKEKMSFFSNTKTFFNIHLKQK